TEKQDHRLVPCTPINQALGLCKYHPGFSALLNNGMTNGGSFLQVGLYFTNKATIDTKDGSVTPGDQACQAPAGCFGEGLVVWASDQSQLGPRAYFKADPAQPAFAFVPYIPG